MTATIDKLVDMLAAERAVAREYLNLLRSAEQRIFYLEQSPASELQADHVAMNLVKMEKFSHRIEAIKWHRKICRSSLKESKDAIEKHWPTAASKAAKATPQ